MRNLTATLPQNIALPIQRYARHKALIRAAALLAAAIFLALALFLCAIILDRCIELPRVLKPILPLAALVVPGLTALFALLALFRGPDAESVAGELDQAAGLSRDAVRSALNFSRRTHHDAASVNPFMLSATLREAEAISARVVPSAALGWGAGPKRLLAALFLGGLILALSRSPYMQMSLLWTRFLNPLGNHPRPSLTQIEIDAPLSQTVIQGDDLALKVRLAGQAPAEPHCTLHILGAGAEQVIVMSPRTQQRFETQIKGIDRSLNFYVTAGDGRSALYSLSVEPRPTVAKMSVRYEYPRYTLFPPREELLTNRELSGVEGTRVTVKFESSLPVADPQAVFPERKYKIDWDKAQRQGTFRFNIQRETGFTISLVAASGADNHGDPGYRVRIVPDNPPTVMLTGIPENAALYRDDLLQLHYKGTDDFGISELFLRCWSGTNSRPKEYSLQMQRPNQKDVDGDATIDLRELTAEDDSQLDLELVMIDTKGQEAFTPRTRVAIISDTPERQLEELARLEETYLKNYLRTAAVTLAAQSGRLSILIEGLDAGTAITGKRKEMLDGICKEIERVRLPPPDRILFLSEYPYQNVRAAYYGLCMATTIPDGLYYTARINALSAGDKAKEGLAEFKPVLDEQAKKASVFAEALSDALTGIRLRLMEQLASKLIAKDDDKAADGKIAQRQEERLSKLLVMGDALGKDSETLELASSLKDLKAASASAGEARPAAVRTAAAQLHRAIVSGPALDGHLSARMESCRAQYPFATLLKTATAQGTLTQLTQALGNLVRLQRNTYVSSDAELFLNVRAVEALFSNEPQRIVAASEACVRLDPWSRRYGLVDRLRLLRVALHEFQIDSTVGRLQPSSPRFEQSWQEAREMLLSILGDEQSGAFPLEKEDAALVRELSSFQIAFQPWNGAEALKAPGFDAKFSTLRDRLNAIIARLEPGVLKETEAALPELALLWRDVAFNVQNEVARLEAEAPLVAAEMAEMEKRPPAEKDSPEFKNRTASAPRAGFGHALADRMAAHSIATAKILDIRERLWMRQPSETTLPQFEAGVILNEYLSHLEEAVYDNASAPHINRAYGGLRSGPYPKYLETVLKYYDELRPTMRTLGTWLAEWAEGRADALLKNPEFSELSTKFNRTERVRTAAKALREHLRFDAAMRATPNPETRRTLLGTYLSGENASVYWDRIYLSASALGTAAGRSLNTAGEAWTGISAEDITLGTASAARAQWLLPDSRPLPEEAKLLPEILEEWHEVSSRGAAGKISALSADARAQVRENLHDLHGKLLGVLRGMEVRTFVAPPKPRVRPRYLTHVRNDLQDLMGRVIRGESAWAARVADEERRVWSLRAQFIAGESLDAGQAPAGVMDEVAWSSAFEQATRRKSAAAFSRRTQALGIEEERIDERFLKMPRYLYEELLRGSKRPYPSQFKTPGIDYMQGLLKSSR